MATMGAMTTSTVFHCEFSRVFSSERMGLSLTERCSQHRFKGAFSSHTLRDCICKSRPKTQKLSGFCCCYVFRLWLNHQHLSLFWTSVWKHFPPRITISDNAIKPCGGTEIWRPERDRSFALLLTSVAHRAQNDFCSFFSTRGEKWRASSLKSSSLSSLNFTLHSRWSYDSDGKFQTRFPRGPGQGHLILQGWWRSDKKSTRNAQLFIPRFNTKAERDVTENVCVWYFPWVDLLKHLPGVHLGRDQYFLHMHT